MAYTFLITLCTIISILVAVDQNKDLKNYLSYISEEEEFTVRTGGSTRVSPNTVKQVEAISILGERNSGTTWMYE